MASMASSRPDAEVPEPFLRLDEDPCLKSKGTDHGGTGVAPVSILCCTVLWLTASAAIVADL